MGWEFTDIFSNPFSTGIHGVGNEHLVRHGKGLRSLMFVLNKDESRGHKYTERGGGARQPQCVPSMYQRPRGLVVVS